MFSWGLKEIDKLRRINYYNNKIKLKNFIFYVRSEAIRVSLKYAMESHGTPWNAITRHGTPCEPF